MDRRSRCEQARFASVRDIDTEIRRPAADRPDAHGELLGAIGYLARRKITPEEYEVLGIFADQAAMAIKSAQLFADIERYKNRLEVENEYLQDEIRAESGFDDIVGQSGTLRAVLQKVRQVAGVETTVLLTGETGTGKELIARALHGTSARKDRPLIKINCGAIPQGVVESELFGHEKGAFTGAIQKRIGRFELADKGTLFMVKYAPQTDIGVEELIDLAKVRVVIVIPERFSVDLKSGRAAPVELLLDGSDAKTANVARGYADAIARTFSQNATSMPRRGPAPVVSEGRVWYNETLDSASMIVPGLIAVIMRTTARIVRGTTRRPTPMSPARNVARRAPVTARLEADTAVPVATVVRIAMRKMPMRSSMMRTPKTISVNRPFTPCSSNAFAMIVVLEIAMTAPANTLSSVVQPRSCPST